jgi:hypothetical protein
MLDFTTTLGVFETTVAQTLRPNRRLYQNLLDFVELFVFISSFEGDWRLAIGDWRFGVRIHPHLSNGPDTRSSGFKARTL